MKKYQKQFVLSILASSYWYFNMRIMTNYDLWGQSSAFWVGFLGTLNIIGLVWLISKTFRK